MVDPNLCDLDVGPIAMVVDCRDLYINHRNRAKGHLGYHHWNVAAVLMSEELRPWRVMRYLELVAMLNSPAMITEGKSASALTFSEKGPPQRDLDVCPCKHIAGTRLQCQRVRSLPLVPGAAALPERHAQLRRLRSQSESSVA